MRLHWLYADDALVICSITLHVVGVFCFLLWYLWLCLLVAKLVLCLGRDILFRGSQICEDIEEDLNSNV